MTRLDAPAAHTRNAAIGTLHWLPRCGRRQQGTCSKCRAANSPQACLGSCVDPRGVLSASRACASSRAHARKISQTDCTDSLDASAHAQRSPRTERCHSCAYEVDAERFRLLFRSACTKRFDLADLQPQTE